MSYLTTSLFILTSGPNCLDRTKMVLKIGSIYHIERRSNAFSDIRKLIICSIFSVLPSLKGPALTLQVLVVQVWICVLWFEKKARISEGIGQWLRPANHTTLCNNIHLGKWARKAGHKSASRISYRRSILVCWQRLSMDNISGIEVVYSRFRSWIGTIEMKLSTSQHVFKAHLPSTSNWGLCDHPSVDSSAHL